MLPKALRSLSVQASISRTIKTALAGIFASVLVNQLAVAPPACAQTAATVHPAHVVPNRLTAPIVDSVRVTLAGSVHPLAIQANDRGALSDSAKLDRLQIVLKRSDAQEAELKQVLNDLHASGSASYHKWLTPEQFGKQFGPSDADIATLESWLEAQGFSIAKLQPGRQVLEISGTAGQLRNAFHTEMHRYAAQDGMHLANATAPDVPAALTPVFGGFVSLNNFRLKSHAKMLGKAEFNAATHESKPDWTIGSASNYNLALAPGDFAVQYDLNPLYAAGTKGDGQTIAIANNSNINIAQVNNYRSLFGLPANPPQVIIDGTDPGIDGINSPSGPNGDSGEAYLDVELAGAVAPNAQIDLVIANDTATSDGLTLAMEHAVYSNIAPIVSVSFGGCEQNQGGYNFFITQLWEQAAAQGQTVLVSTGDSGSAGCDRGTEFAVYGQAVNGLASTAYNVAVGGTDFYYSGGSASVSNYWNTTPSNTTPVVSLNTPAPEQPWNDSQYGLNLFSVYNTDGSTSISAGSGGPSTAGVQSSDGSTVSPHPKPSWQTGVGVPADGARDQPDVSLFAANGLNNSYYPVCADDGDCQPVASGQSVQISGVGGTSASTPAFAGMMALVNQKYGRQGQANYVLYPLAAQFPSTFHDITVGTIAVPCATTTVADANNNNLQIAPKNCKAVSNPITLTSSNADTRYGTTTEGELSVDGTNPAYNAGTGYDLATGLGTVDANNLVNNWNKITFATTSTTLAPSLTAFPHGTSITISGTVSGSSPTGDVALLTTSTDTNNQGQTFFTLANGAYSHGINFLPGGSYNIYGHYEGDGANASSNSAPVAITVTPENSTTGLNVYSALNPLTTLGSGQSLNYGALAILDAEPAGAAQSTPPSGTVTFLDGSAAVGTVPLNANGVAQYNSAPAVGSHSITAKYSGDSSYGGSTSAAKTFTVTQNTPNILVTATNDAGQTDSSGNEYLLNGQATYLTVQVENSASVNGLATAPTGTITMTGAPSGSTTSATLVPGVSPNGLPQGTAIFTVPATASGAYQLAFQYAGDANYNKVSSSTFKIDFAAASGLTVPTTTTATASAASSSPTGPVTVTATVSSTSAAPSGVVYLVSSSYIVGYANLSGTTSTTSTATIFVNSATLFQGNNLITAQYIPADKTSFELSAATVTINNPLSDFSLVPEASILSVPASGTQTGTVDLTSYNGFSGTVNLSCQSPTAGILCSLSSLSVPLTTGTQVPVTLSVNTAGVAGAGTYPVVVTGTNQAGTVVHSAGVQIVTPQITAASFSLTGTAASIASPGASGSTITVNPINGFSGNVDLTCAVTGPPGTSAGPTCSAASVAVSGSTPATTQLTVNTTSAIAAGTYTLTVTGTSGSVTATTSIPVTVTGGTASFALAGTAVTIASQGATGTSTITVTPANGFTGSVALTCAVTSAPSGAVSQPTCSATSASVTGSGAATATLTINTTAPTTARLETPARPFTGRGIFTGGGATLATILLLTTPFAARRRRSLKALRTVRLLSMAALFALLAGAAIGCGSGSSSTTPPPTSTGGTTTGSYTLTVTGTSGSTTATTTVTVTVN